MALVMALPPPLPPQQRLKPRRSFRCSAARPAVILPGLGNNTSDYEKFQHTLKGYGVQTVVAEVSRVDWLRNAAGLVDPNYWRGTLQPRPVLDWPVFLDQTLQPNNPTLVVVLIRDAFKFVKLTLGPRYLKRVDKAVSEAKELANGESLSLIGHSAGGWLARLYMEEFGLSNISLLLTLGTPHSPPPKGSPGVIDQTRGLLYYVENHCARAVYTPELRYVCIAGRYIKGVQFFGDLSTLSSSSVDIEIAPSDSNVAIVNATNSSTSASPTFRARVVGQGYKQVCGNANVWGDGVVPEIAAHLEGALNISFDGVYHSPVGSDDLSRPWYGSPTIVDQWIHHLLN